MSVGESVLAGPSGSAFFYLVVGIWGGRGRLPRV